MAKGKKNKVPHTVPKIKAGAELLKAAEAKKKKEQR